MTRARSTVVGRAAARSRPRAPATRAPLAHPQPLGVLALVGWTALLVFAPPANNYVWGVNGFASLPTPARLALAALALASALLVAVRGRGAWRWGLVLALALAPVLAFLMRESTHVLGDTAVRLRAIAVFNDRGAAASLDEWSHRLHANPLDLLVNFLLPIGLYKLGGTIEGSACWVSLGLFVLFAFGVWRIARRLEAPPETRLAVAAAIVLAGTLQAFAGYAESTGLLLATAAWWWAEMLAPLGRRAQGVRTASAWFVMFLAHRMSLLMLLPMAWRAFGPPRPDDTPEARRVLALWTGVAVALAGVTLWIGVGGAQLGRDSGEMLAVVRHALAAVPPSDVLNALALVAPLAWLAPWLAGRDALRAWWVRPETRLLALAALPLVPLVWLLPAGESGLGAQRDWDLAALPGFTLTLVAAVLLVRLPLPRLRSALAWCLPVLVLHTGGWVLVNSYEPASLARVKALLDGPPRLYAPHLAALHIFLGRRAMDLGQPAASAPHYEAAYALNPNARSLLLAAESWARAGELMRARADVAHARSVGPLSPGLTSAAAQIDVIIARLTTDSARVAHIRTSGP